MRLFNPRSAGTRHIACNSIARPICVIVALSIAYIQSSWGANAASNAAFQLGASLAHKRKPRLAIPHFSRAIQLDPTNGDAFLERSRAHLELEEYKQALSDATIAIRLLKNSQAYQLRAPTQVEQLQYKEAKADITKAIELNQEAKDSWILYEFRAKVHLLMNDEKAAYSDLTKAIGSGSVRHSGPYYYRANILLKWKKYQSAIDDYTQALKSGAAGDVDDKICANRAQAYDKIGRKDLAAKDREKLRKGTIDWAPFLEEKQPKQ